VFRISTIQFPCCLLLSISIFHLVQEIFYCIHHTFLWPLFFWWWGRALVARWSMTFACCWFFVSEWNNREIIASKENFPWFEGCRCTTAAAAIVFVSLFNISKWWTQACTLLQIWQDVFVFTNLSILDNLNKMFALFIYSKNVLWCASFVCWMTMWLTPLATSLSIWIWLKTLILTWSWWANTIFGIFLNSKRWFSILCVGFLTHQVKAWCIRCWDGPTNIQLLSIHYTFGLNAFSATLFMMRWEKLKTGLTFIFATDTGFSVNR